MTRAALLALLAGVLVTPLATGTYATIVSLTLDRDLERWARHDAAIEMTRSLFVALDLYRRDHQRVPEQQHGLAALVPNYVRAVPVDPWGTPFVYQTRGADWADVVSLGADATPGGSGLATDVSARYGSPGTATSRSLVQVLLVLLLALPGLAYASARVWPTAEYFLAGIALFWGWAVASTVGPNAAPSPALAAAFATIIVALSGGVMILRGLPGGITCALTGAVCCLIATAAMMA